MLRSWPAVAAWLLLLVPCATAQEPAKEPAQPPPAAEAPARFEPVELWIKTILSGDLGALVGMYTVNPAAIIRLSNDKPGSVQDEIEFWIALRKEGLSSIRVEEMLRRNLRADAEQAIFQLELVQGTAAGPRKLYVTFGQIWLQQGEKWRILASQHTELARLKQPLAPKQDLYRADEDAKAKIQDACTRATRGGKRVIVVFGANWCYDCHVLEAAFHSPEIAPKLEAGFEVVHVDIGKGDRNMDLMQKYEVPLEKGVPALVVLDADGNVLYSQKNGEFEATRRMAPEDILAFLERWKPRREK